MHAYFCRSAALTTAALLALASCGGSPENSDRASPTATSSPSARPPVTTTPSVAAASGPKISGTGYSFRAPMGWRKQAQDTPVTQPADTVAAEVSRKGGFPQNVNVLVLPRVPEMSGDALRTSLQADLTKIGMKGVELKETGQLDGREMIHASAQQNLSGLEYLTEQYITTKGGNLYIVTVSVGTDVPKATRIRISTSILGTWKWTS